MAVELSSRRQRLKLLQSITSVLVVNLGLVHLEPAYVDNLLASFVGLTGGAEPQVITNSSVARFFRLVNTVEKFISGICANRSF